MTASNTFGQQVVVPLTNKSGGGVIAGDVVIVGTANNDAFTTTTSAAFTGTIGVAQETIANDATGRVLLSGYAALINTTASVTRQNFGTTSTTVKKAVDAGASRVAGTFCQFLTGGTTPDGIVYPSDLGSGSGTGTVTTIKDEGTNLSTAVVSVDFVGAGVTATGTTAVTVTIPGGAIANTQVFLANDVTMTTADTFYDGPTYTPAAGTWLLMGSAIINNGSGGGQREVAKLWDGTTAYAASQVSNGAAGNLSQITCDAIVSATGSQTFKMSVAGNGGSQTMLKTPNTDNTGLTGLGTYLIAIRLA